MTIETYLKEYGFEYKTISKIKKLSLKDNNIENNLKYFEKLEYSKDSILKEINFEFNDKSIKYLFSDNKKFTTKFKISKKELLKKISNSFAYFFSLIITSKLYFLHIFIKVLKV